MAKKNDAKKAERKIKEALEILESLGFPRQQQNECSALTLLSLLNLKPDDPWESASAPLIGITSMNVLIKKIIDEISWETEVWIAEAPTHLVHFIGERFLGPYED